MLIQLAIQQPQAIPRVLAATPAWVWALLAALLALGASQLRDRTASLARVSAMPVAMTAFSLWGTVSAFGRSPLLPQAVLGWAVAALVIGILVGRGRTGARYDAATRRYAIGGSVVPLLLILAIFLLKYVVGVDLAMAPGLLHDAGYLLPVAALYGATSGLFLGRAARLWRLALHAHRRPAAA